MKIINWNVNGIRAVHKKGLFAPFVEKYKPDIICLQETKALEHQSEVDLPEYEEYWNSATRPGYSGTAIFTKIKPLSVILGIPEKIAKKLQETTQGKTFDEKWGKIAKIINDTKKKRSFLAALDMAVNGNKKIN